MINVSLNVARSRELADQINAFLAAGGEITELADQINAFLAAGGEITELAHGATGIKEPDPTKPRKAQDTMRSIMSRSVYAERANRKLKTEAPKKENEYVRRVNFNRQERIRAECEGRVVFTGDCKHHGLTQFRSQRGDRHYCCECKRVLTIKKDLKRKQAREIARKNAEISA